MARRSSEFDLGAAIADPGFTPSLRDVPRLLELLVGGGDAREAAERALRRVGASVVPAVIARASEGAADGRARLVALVGRLDVVDADPAARGFLLGALGDAEAGVRRRAAAGLGRVRADAGGEVAAALAEALGREVDAAARGAIVEALGKVGGAGAEKALAGLDGAAVTEAKTAAQLAKARLRAARPAARAEASAIDVDRPLGDTSHVLGGGVRVWLDCRRGLAPVLLEEAAAFSPTLEHRADGSSVVAVRHTGPLSALFAARTWSTLAFPGATMKVAKGADRVAAAAHALVGGGARAAAAALTSGPLRYRIAWAGGGKRRAEVYRIAEAAAVLEPSLVNDPTDAPWEVVLRESATSIAAEWVPSLVDPRFAYRQDDVPAASHPTIAAALVFLAGAEPGDVVWDPFVGSGLELCERALRGPYEKLVGTDLEPDAVEVARANLRACGAQRYDVRFHDAEEGAPAGLKATLVITNPPMGRRVHRRSDLRELLAKAIRSAAGALVTGGRFVWVSPFPAEMRRVATSAGLVFTRGHQVDLGGFEAEIQVFRKA